MKNILKFFLLFLSACVLQSCTQDHAAVYPTYNDYHVPASSQKLVLLSTYSYQQTTAYTCGPSVIMNLMYFYGKLTRADMNRNTELRIANEMQSTGNGTSQEKIVSWLEQHGFSVTYGDNASTSMIINNLNRNIPTIIGWNDWNAHATLVIGYVKKNGSKSDNDDVLFIADPSSTSFIMENNKFHPGINTLTSNQVQLNWFNANHFFNPSHAKAGMYIVAVPR